IEATIFSGEKFVVSANFVDPEFDSGLIVSQSCEMDIIGLSFDTLYDIASHVAAEMIKTILENFVFACISSEDQDPELVTEFNYPDLYRNF
ncbi:MAG: hypothetical protein P8176_15615, partial [Gammaproteobacteria bacterium]